MKYYLGVDAGGTKTRVVLTNDNLEIVLDQTYTSGHLLTIGMDNYIKLYESILNDVETKVSRDDLANVFVASAGYGEFKSDNDEMRKALAKIFGFTKWDIMNDSIGAWAGSLLCRDGINIIAGTGSIVSCLYKGNYYRIGGLAHVAGDEGSAYWISRRGLNIYSKMFDGRLEKTVLFDLINEKFNLDDERNFMFVVHREMNEVRTEIAKFSSVVSEAASKGCKYSMEILADGARELVLAVMTAIKKSGFEGIVPISYSGGVWNSEIFLKYFIAEIKENKINYEIVTPYLEPAYGSALYSYILCDNEINDDIRATFLKNAQSEV